MKTLPIAVFAALATITTAKAATLKHDMVACQQLRDFKNLVDIGVRQGSAAAASAIDRAIRLGDCQVFESGERVVVVEYGFGTRCIARPDMRQCWWTNSESIRE